MKKIESIYVIGSLRNPAIPKFANYLRKFGFDVFDDWFAAGPRADWHWRNYEKGRGRNYAEALKGYAATHVFGFDLSHLQRCDAAVMLMPAGKSGHLELAFMRGCQKPAYILFDREPARFDVMTKFSSGVFFNKKDLIKELKK